MPYSMYIKCACGRAANVHVEDLPEAARNGDLPGPAAIDRMVCARCGRRGRPEAVAIFWDSALDLPRA